MVCTYNLHVVHASSALSCMSEDPLCFSLLVSKLQLLYCTQLPLICLVCAFSVSSFCIGQTQLRCLKLTTFFYCRPTPYLAQVETGLHKRMRWNVVRLANEHCKENLVGNIE